LRGLSSCDKFVPNQDYILEAGRLTPMKIWFGDRLNYSKYYKKKMHLSHTSP